MRNAIVAGSFYPAKKEELERQIRNFLESVKDKPESKNQIYGVISPHAGYIYSGQCAAYSYSMVRKQKIDTFVILGTNHTGYAESDFALSAEDFETPLGIAKNDRGFYDVLISRARNNKISIGDSTGDKFAHENEHSIEVQIPFLQYISGNNLKILPVICQIKKQGEYNEFANLLVETAKNLGRKICVIASSDFTHYGSSYGFIPFISDVKKNLYQLDKKAIELILRFKTNKFLDYACRTTICGAGAIAACIEICKALGSKKAELLKYYTSGDVTNDYKNAVGYASIAFI